MTTIRSLDDVTLVITGQRIHARLCAASERRVVTLLFTNVDGEPVYRIGRLLRVRVERGAANCRSPWYLSLWWRGLHQGGSHGISRAFPANPVILLRGAPNLDLGWLLPLPPIEDSDDIRDHVESYLTRWGQISGYCAAVAGSDAVLIDTTREASLAYCRQLQECRE